MINKQMTTHYFIGFIFAILILIIGGCHTNEIQKPIQETNTISPDLLTTVSQKPDKTSTQVFSTSTPIPTPSMTPFPVLLPIGGVEVNRLSSDYGLDLLEISNIHWIRLNGIIWADVEPKESIRNWEALEKIEGDLINASKSGFNVILVIRHTPPWAQSINGSLCGPIKQDKLKSFGNFMFDLVSRYSKPPYNVKYWELGNEPDIDPTLVPYDSQYGCWGDQLDPYYGGGYYAEMLKATYPKIKEADIESNIIIGGLLLNCDPTNPPETKQGSGEYVNCESSKFLEGILQNGGGEYFDGVSFHAYDYYYGSYGKYGNPNWHSSWENTGPVVNAKANFLDDILIKYDYPNKFLMNTETALLCTSNKANVCISDEFEETKASYLAESLVAAKANSLFANIWYSMTGWRHSGLTTADYQPKQAFVAYEYSLKMLNNASFIRKINDYPDVLGYEFQSENQRIWFLRSFIEEPKNIHLPLDSYEIHDIYGNLLEKIQDITITLNPIYIVWQE